MNVSVQMSALCLLGLAAVTPSLSAETNAQATPPVSACSEATPAEPAQEAEHEAAHEQEHEMHRHHVALFLGASRSEGIHGGTVGFDYELRLHHYVGVGLGGEVAGGGFRDWVVTFPITFHPGGGFRLLAGPGWERPLRRGEGESETDLDEMEGHGGSEEGAGRELLFRAGALYDWPQGRFTISPSFSVDFVEDGRIYVYGLSFGVGF